MLLDRADDPSEEVGGVAIVMAISDGAGRPQTDEECVEAIDQQADMVEVSARLARVLGQARHPGDVARGTMARGSGHH